MRAQNIKISTVSTPIFASKAAFFSIFQALPENRVENASTFQKPHKSFAPKFEIFLEIRKMLIYFDILTNFYYISYFDISYFDINLWISEDMKCSQISRVSASDASKHIESIIDVSNSEDWEVLHVKGISNVPLIELVNFPEKIIAGSVLYCGNGHKSMAAASFLLTKNIITSDITGGLSAMLVDSPDLEI